MFHFPVSARSFEAILEDLGAARSRLGPLRTAAHSACARRRHRGFASRRDDSAALAAILVAAEDPFPALRRSS
jgi:hypothetical protein